MPRQEFLDELSDDFGLQAVPRLSERFGSSYEATVFRLATAYRGFALAGLLIDRYRKNEERTLAIVSQPHLFADTRFTAEPPQPKYRRQSLHASMACRPEHLIPWNKSFPESSCVYVAAEADEIQRGQETLPTRSQELGYIEAIRAPYQRTVDPSRRPDMLFLWWK
jgi:hypothetical protein